MSRDQLAIIGNHAGHGLAELDHAGSDLRRLVVAVHLAISSIGPQPTNRPRLDLARREDKVHGVVLILGRADMPVSAVESGSGRIGNRELEKNESSREGFPPGAIFR